MRGLVHRPALAAAVICMLAPAAARAADPIMPLGDVQPGMRCTGLSVIHGTAISSFDVEVLDVLGAGQPQSARIVVRASGASVDATGLGPGFSGSPIYCTGADGISRNIGAISEGIGEYGNFTMLARPIEAILSAPLEPVATPLPVGARSLAGPLTISGVRPEFGRALARAARRAGRTLVSSPAPPRVASAPVALVPGAAVSIGVTSGDISVGTVGTVAYADGDGVWVFGHEFEGSGRRSLFLQDAYIHAIIRNPVNAEDLSTYKLASPGADVGTVTGDAPTAVTGRIGALPPSFPLRVTARDLDTGQLLASNTQIADEADVGRPSGAGTLGLTSASAVAEAVTTLLNGGPARQSGDMCVSIGLRELTRPARFCNTYAVDGAGPNFLAGALMADVGTAAALLDTYRFAALHPTGVDIGIRVRRGNDQAFIVGATAPPAVRRGSTVTVRMRVRFAGSDRIRTRSIRVPIPLDIGTGTRTLRLTGTSEDAGADPFDDSALVVLLDQAPGGAGEAGAKTPALLAKAIEAVHRDDRVRAKLGTVTRRIAARDGVRISGQAQIRLRIRSGRG
ncbi:MAG: hypothetical protein QOG42_240 [Solirubrobacteraceae bacterium]|nr:hypothetical protein [Solirubrobacteraceae bacterium]